MVAEIGGRAGAKKTWNRKEAQSGAVDDQNWSKSPVQKKHSFRLETNGQADENQNLKGFPSWTLVYSWAMNINLHSIYSWAIVLFMCDRHQASPWAIVHSWAIESSYTLVCIQEPTMKRWNVYSHCSCTCIQLIDRFTNQPLRHSSINRSLTTTRHVIYWVAKRSSSTNPPLNY